EEGLYMVTRGINCDLLTISRIPIQITIPRIKPQRILADPPRSRRVVVASPVVLQLRLDVEFTPGPSIPADRAGNRLGCISERVIGNFIDRSSRVIQHRADRVQVVRQVEIRIAVPNSRKMLVDTVAL